MPEYQGEKFRLWLENKLISVDKAREVLGLSTRQTVYQYFNSKNLSRKTVSNILTKFDVTAKEVFGVDIDFDTEPKHSQNMNRYDQLRDQLIESLSAQVKYLSEQIESLKQKLRKYEDSEQSQKIS